MLADVLVIPHQLFGKDLELTASGSQMVKDETALVCAKALAYILAVFQHSTVALGAKKAIEPHQ